MTSSLAVNHPLLTIPEEDQSACSDYSVPSDCNCFTDIQKTNKEKLNYQYLSSDVIQGNKGPLLPGSKKSLSNRKNNSCGEPEDTIFAWRLMTIREKLEVTLLNVYLSISNIPEPDGLQDLIRRRQRAAEFTARFCRNYLYQFQRQVLALRHRLKEKSCCGLQYIYKASMSQKLLNAYELAHLSLQAVLNHIPSSTLMCIPKKLREFLKLMIELTEISSKSGVISGRNEDSGDEIAKYCRDLLMLVPDSNEHLNGTDNKGYDKKRLKSYGKINLMSRFSMYNENSSIKRKTTALRSVSCTKKSESSGKESRTSLESSQSSQKSSHSLRCNEIPVSMPKRTKNCIRKKREEHSKPVEKVSVKNHVHTPFNMDSITTVIETISSAKSEENGTGDEQEHNLGFTGNVSISSEKHTKPINNCAVTECQNKQSNQIEFQPSSNVKLIILPPFEESGKVSGEKTEQYTPSQATTHTKNEEFENNICNDLVESRPVQKVEDTQVTFQGEHICQSPVKDCSKDASSSSQSSFEPIHLEQMLTYTKDRNHTQYTVTKPVKETFTENVIELEGKTSVMLDQPDNSLHLEKMVTNEKDDDSCLLGPGTAPVQRTSPRYLSSMCNTENLAEQQGNQSELIDTINKTNAEISQNVVLLKMPTAELECILEHKKRFVQYMNNNPLYMNSAKPWIIVSRLADTLISDVMLEVMHEIELETDKTVTKMFQLELQ